MDTITIKVNNSIEMMTSNVEPVVIIYIDDSVAVKMFYNGEVRFEPVARLEVNKGLVNVVLDIIKNHMVKMRSDKVITRSHLQDIRKDFKKYLLMIRKGFTDKEELKNE